MKHAFRLFPILFALLTAIPFCRAEQLPEYRPALPTHGRRSLINLIDVNSLIKRGQGSATVMFTCYVNSLGFAAGVDYYRGTPGSDMLGKEVVRRCNQAQFMPAVYHHIPVDVYICATASLIIKDGKPHLRLFMNQEESDLLKGRDFVAPQFTLDPANYKFRGIYWPPGVPGHSGLATVRLDVDETGQVHSCQTVYEYPSGMGFGRQVGTVCDAWFIPGFRDGKPVRSQFTWVVSFHGPGRQMSTG